MREPTVRTGPLPHQNAYQQRVPSCVPLREPAPILPAEIAQMVDTGKPGSR